ncbi:MAG: hypothetical protein KatS3mg022_0665 [Armatimonadota bacterium]|nr:MAG: hypothetical protein KatS3mg022_0665 [Armatimonadota bacterium]
MRGCIAEKTHCTAVLPFPMLHSTPHQSRNRAGHASPTDDRHRRVAHGARTTERVPPFAPPGRTFEGICREVVLFGSLASEKPSPDDIDLAVFLNSTQETSTLARYACKMSSVTHAWGCFCLATSRSILGISAPTCSVMHGVNYPAVFPETALYAQMSARGHCSQRGRCALHICLPCRMRCTWKG